MQCPIECADWQWVQHGPLRRVRWKAAILRGNELSAKQGDHSAQRGHSPSGNELRAKAIKTKFDEKQRQFSQEGPNVVFLAYVADSDPWGRTVDELNRGISGDVITEAQGRPLVSGAVVFRQSSNNWMFDREAIWFNPCSKFPLDRCEQGGIRSLAQEIGTFDRTP